MIGVTLLSLVDNGKISVDCRSLMNSIFEQSSLGESGAFLKFVLLCLIIWIRLMDR